MRKQTVFSFSLEEAKRRNSLCAINDKQRAQMHADDAPHFQMRTWTGVVTERERASAHKNTESSNVGDLLFI